MANANDARWNYDAVFLLTATSSDCIMHKNGRHIAYTVGNKTKTNQ